MRHSLVLSLVLGAIPGVAFGGYYEHLALPVYWQDDACWCSAATLEMWADWENSDSWYSSHQSDLASTYDIDCTGGLNVNDMANALEDETPNWYQSVSTTSGSTFASRIVKEIHSGVPVAVVAYTRYNDDRGDHDGDTTDDTADYTANQHWLIVDAYELTRSSYSYSYSYIDSFWLNDPAYGAGITYVDTVSPSEEIDAADFLAYYASKYSSKYYLVED